jgi:hypothetical protein
VGIAVVVVAAIVFAAVQLALPGGRAATRCERLLAAGGPTGPSTGPTGPTVAEPLSAPAKQMTMAAARSAFGVSVPLPDTPAVRPADAGAIWEGTLSGVGTMKVAFPSKGLMIFYRRHALYRDPTQEYQQIAGQMSDARFVELNGTTPALAITENSDDTCANFGSVAFVMNGTEVLVFDHTDQASLEAIAQSILARWPV